MEGKIKVRLLVDLTKYANGLVVGTEGYTVGSKGIWSRANDNFVTVCFPQIATLEVLWKSLEIIDEAYLKRKEEANNEWLENLKKAKCVELHLGSRGGFRYLAFKYIDSDGKVMNYNCGSKNKAKNVMKIFKENNIPIKEIIED